MFCNVKILSWLRYFFFYHGNQCEITHVKSEYGENHIRKEIEKIT